MADTDVIDRPEPVEGVDPSILETLDSLPMSFEALPESAFDDREFTLVGFSEKAGGENRMDEATGREYVTNDQWLIHWRADEEDIAAMLADSGGKTIQYLTLPRSFVGPNGVKRRPAPTRSTTAGIFIGVLDSLGVSGDPQRAHRLHMTSWSDLLGLRVIRKRMSYSMGNGRNARSQSLDVPVRILGIDNEYRKSKGLKAIKISDDTPELNT